MRLNLSAYGGAVLCVVAGMILQANEPTPTPSPKVRVTLEDGSQVYFRLLTEVVVVETPYGTLKVPVQDIRSVQLGLHHAPGELEAIAASVKALGSASFKERDTASRMLTSAGRKAVPALIAATKSPDREVSAAAAQIRGKIRDNDPLAEAIPEQDVVQTRRVQIEGKIVGDGLRVQSSVLGEMTLRLCDIAAVRFPLAASGKVVVDASQHSDTNWLETGIVASPGTTLRITATGTVDLWPQTPGQYPANPAGYSTIGKGGRYRSGALIGRIGAGESFLIGSECQHIVQGEGALQLQIVASPWNSASAGTYTVEVTTRLE